MMSEPQSGQHHKKSVFTSGHDCTKTWEEREQRNPKVLSLGCFEQRFVHLSYSGYWLKKYRYPKSGLDSAVVKFRPNSGYMDFFNQ